MLAIWWLCNLHVAYSKTRFRNMQPFCCTLSIGPSANCFLHERADPCLFGSGQLLQREGGRPHVAFVEGRPVAEAERCVPRLELLSVLEEADDLAVLGVRGHPVPEFRRER